MRLQERNPFASPKDVSKNNHSKPNDKTKRNIIIISLVVASIIILFFIVKGNTVFTTDAASSNKSNEIKNYKQGKFSKFPTVQEALGHAELVGIYFASPWSNECEEVTQDLDEAFSYYGFLLSPLDLLSIEMNLPEAKEVLQKKRSLAIVFVSSSSSMSIVEESDYGSEEWLRVHGGTKEGALLQEYFHVSTAKEKRKYGIPHLVVIDARSEDVITENGVDDIRENAPHAYEIWQEKLKTNT